MDQRGLIIAVDGYSSTGKSTVSKLLAARLGYTYIDTGAMYRMVTYEAMRTGVLREGMVDEAGVRGLLSAMDFGFTYNPLTCQHDSFIGGVRVEDEIRGLEVSGQVSLIASLPYVREVLVERQREMAAGGGVIMDGRDIGSVVFPHADVKFFMTASPEIRARRRYDEMVAKGEPVSYQEVEENVRRRDEMDSQRAVAPLVKTADAICVDNSTMTIEEVVEEMLHVIRTRHAGRD